MNLRTTTTEIALEDTDRPAQFTIILQASEAYGKIEVGLSDSENLGHIAFGMSAEVFVNNPYSSEVAKAGVSQAAIGSHDVETADLRVAAYARAVELARIINAAQASNPVDGVQAVLDHLKESNR